MVKRHCPPPPTFHVKAYGTRDDSSISISRRPCAVNSHIAIPTSADHHNSVSNHGSHGSRPFHFVTKGIESALEQAAGEKEVSLEGGASVAQQYLAAGLLDEIVVSVVPILLGGGARLFENVGRMKLEQVESVGAPGVTHIRYARA